MCFLDVCKNSTYIGYIGIGNKCKTLPVSCPPPGFFSFSCSGFIDLSRACLSYLLVGPSAIGL